MFNLDEINELIEKTEKALIELKKEKKKLNDAELIHTDYSGIFVTVQDDYDHELIYFKNSLVQKKDDYSACLFDINHGVIFGNGSIDREYLSVVKLNETSLEKLYRFIVDLANNQEVELDEDT